MAKPAPKGDEKNLGGDMSVREAGKKGGNTVRDRYGSGFYEEIGRKGGKATRERHGLEFYESIGQKGGRVVKEKYGVDFFTRHDVRFNLGNIAAHPESFCITGLFYPTRGA